MTTIIRKGMPPLTSLGGKILGGRRDALANEIISRVPFSVRELSSVKDKPATTRDNNTRLLSSIPALTMEENSDKQHDENFGHINTGKAFLKTVAKRTTSANPDPVNFMALGVILQNIAFTLSVIPSKLSKGITEHFREVIELSVQSRDFQGEKVLTVQHPTDEHDPSIHFLYFKGKQDPHIHRGPRILNVVSAEKWALYVGQSLRDIPEKGDLNVVKIIFPANSLVNLSLLPNTLHGFEGKDLAAISMHYTDEKEVKEASESFKALKSLIQEDLNADKGEKDESIQVGEILEKEELMGLLTVSPNPDRVKVIREISYGDVGYIKKKAREEAARPTFSK